MSEESKIFVFNDDDENEKYVSKTIAEISKLGFSPIRISTLSDDLIPKLNSTSVLMAFTSPTSSSSSDASLSLLFDAQNTGAEVFVIPSGNFTSKNEIEPINPYSIGDTSLRNVGERDSDTILRGLSTRAVAMTKPINPEKQVFISSSEEMRHAAKELKNICNDNRIKVWHYKDALAGGDRWKEKIDEEIGKSAVVAVLLEENSMKSHYVTYEWAYAMGKGVGILPLLVNECNNMHPKIKDIQYVKFDDTKVVIDRLKTYFD